MISFFGNPRTILTKNLRQDDVIKLGNIRDRGILVVISVHKADDRVYIVYFNHYDITSSKLIEGNNSIYIYSDIIEIYGHYRG